MNAPVLKMNAKLKLIHEHAENAANEYLHYEGKLLQALIDVDKTGAYKCFGYRHLTPYCVKKLGLSEDVAAVFVRVARKSLEVPELAQAVANGEIQITKAKAIASVITKENKREWMAKAATQTKYELEKEVTKSSGRTTKTLTLELTPEEHEIFHRLRELLAAKLDHFPTKEEAHAWMVEKTLNKIDPLRKAHRSQNRSAEEEVTVRDEAKCQAELSDGTRCGEKKWTHQHHIIHRVNGGLDTAENLITLCASHHRAVHEAT